jgi:hypothetical protein
MVVEIDTYAVLRCCILPYFAKIKGACEVTFPSVGVPACQSRAALCMYPALIYVKSHMRYLAVCVPLSFINVFILFNLLLT